ncbi:hypothetical protein HUJ05_010030, partial [Dendroctonus ponderosae]
MLLLWYVFVLIITTGMMVVGFLLVTSENFQDFKECWGKRAPRITELPIITPTGQIVNSVEDLDMQLEFLENQLEEKEKEVESSKSKLEAAAERLEKLGDTTNQVKKYYVKLKTDVAKSETEINELRNQIDDFKMRQLRLREEVNENVKYYTGMLNNIEHTVANDEFEIVKRSLLSGRY